MSEAQTINPNFPPLTVDLLAAGFADCGLAPGQTVIVHTAMRKLGWVVGGPVAVIQALLQVLGPQGNLVMPAHTTDNSEPSHWQNPPVPESWWPIIRAHMPAYDPATSPLRQMGKVAETFVHWPGAIRSSHPANSFVALGPQAAYLTADHRLESGLGARSPLARLYDLDGYVLLIGVDHSNNTSLHLAEDRAEWPGKPYTEDGVAMLVDGERRWVTYRMLDYDADDFAQLGDAYEAAAVIPRHTVGQAQVRFMRQRPLVDFAVQWVNANRGRATEAGSSATPDA
ncbi:MAG: AAC(3) family N-acetyltransferase [Chloroflexi bacterium]|nr:AAC(3) family N-acetyltransferase [Chloroflexota bacterium]